MKQWASKLLGTIGRPSLTRRVAVVGALLVGGVAIAPNPRAAFALNTANLINNGQSDLSLSGTYAGGTPTAASDVEFDTAATSTATYSPTAFTLNTNTSITYGTLNDFDSVQTLTIQNTLSGASSTINLNTGSGANGVAPATTDLLYVISGGTLNIGGGAGTLTLGVGISGTFDIAGSATINSAITASSVRTVKKTGAGALLLSAANSGFAGTFELDNGTLTLTNANAFSAGTISLVGSTGNTSVLQLRSNSTATFADTATTFAPSAGGVTIDVDALTTPVASGQTLTLGSGGITWNGGGAGQVVNITNNGGANKYNLSLGAISIASVTPNLNNNMVNGTTTIASINNAGSAKTFTLGGSSSTATTSIGNITQTSSALTFTDNNTGTVNLTGTNSYTGATTFSAGTVNLSGTLGNSGGTAISVTGAALNETSAGVIAGTSSLSVSAGSATLAGANTYSGPTAVSLNVTLNVNSVSALGSSSFGWGTSTLNNTSGAAIVMTSTNNTTWNGDSAFGTSAGTALNSLTINGTFSESAAHTLTLNGGGALAFAGSMIYTTVSTANTTVNNIFNNGTGTSSTTAISFGGFNLGPSGSANLTQEISGSANVNFTGAITDSAGSGSANGLLFAGAGAYTLGGNNNFAGLAKLNSATASLTITGSNSLETGGLTLTAGKLNLNSTGALGGGTLTLSGGTLDNTSGSAKVFTSNAPVSIGGGFTFSTSAGTSANNLTFGSGAVSLTASPTITLNGTGSVIFGGALVNAADSARTMTVNLGTGTSSATAISFAGYNLTGATSTLARVDTINGSGLVNITGAIADGVSAGSGLTYSGTGTLNSSGNNTYTGLTTVSSGTLTLSGTNSSASGGVTLGGGTLDVNSATALGTGAFTISGGTLDNTSGGAIVESANPVFNFSSDFSFSTSAGTSNNSLSLGTGQTNFTADHTITLNGAGALGIGSLIDTTNNTTRTLVVNNGTGTTSTTVLNIAGYTLNGYTGTATAKTQLINGSGNVNITGLITDGNVAGSGISYGGTGTLTLSGTDNYTGTSILSSAGTLTMSGSFTSPVSLTGSGILNLSGSTTGTVSLGGSGTLNLSGSSSGATVTLGGNGTLNLSGSTTAASYTVSGATGSLVETTAGVIGGSTATFTINNGTATLAGQNTYGGVTTLAGGTLNVAADSTVVSGTVTNGALGTGALLLSTGTIASSGGAHTVANTVYPNADVAGAVGGTNALTFSGLFDLYASASMHHYTTLTVNNTALTTFAGGIDIHGEQLTFNGSGNILVNSAIVSSSGGGAGGNPLTYSGTGTLTLAGNNTFTGNTSVNSGTVLVTGTTGTSGATFGVTGTLGGNGTITTQRLTANAGSTLSPGATGAGSAGPLAVTGNVTLTSGGNLVYDLASPGAGGTAGDDLISIAGTLTVGTNEVLTVTGPIASNSTYFLIDYSGSLTGSVSGWTVAGIDPSLAAFSTSIADPDGAAHAVSVSFGVVPEPTSLTLLGLGAMSLLGRRRRLSRLAK